MTKLRFLGLFAVILLLPFFSLGQFTRQQAKDLVLKQILASDTGHIKVYSSLDTIPDTSNIILSNGQTITPPYQSNWVFFSDDYPFATWFHPCRYVLVNSSNGDYTIDPAGIYPFDFQNAYGLILAPAILPPYVPPCQDIDPTYATPNPHLHAVLIAGATYIPISGNQQTNFDGDLSLIYNTLIERGYPPSNITVLDYNGDCNRIEWNGALAGGTNCVITGPAYRSWIDNVFSSFYPNNGSTTLYPDDQLFVYVTDHGTAVSTTNNGLISAMCIPSGPNYLDPTDYYTSNDMINAVRPIQCAQMIFLFQCCQAGTFQTLLNDGSALT